MAYGTLQTDVINSSTGLFSTNNAYSGIAKAWAQFNGANGTINGSFNISSITRNSSGNYTVNFTTAMTNANYAVNATLSPNAAGTVNGGPVTMFTNGGGTLVTPTTSAFQFVTFNLSNSYFDANWVSLSVFGA